MTSRDPAPSATTTSPDLPWRVRLFISFFSLITDATCRSNHTVNRFLLSIFDPRVSPNPRPVRGVRTADVTVDPSRNLWFRLFLPAASPNAGGRLPVVVYFHGGGFVFFSPASRLFDDLCRWLCREIPVAIVSVNYRLAPENRCPAPYDDGMDVLRFLDSQGGAEGGPTLLREFFEVADLSSCFLFGDSAGANIAHHVARRWSAGEALAGQGRVALAGLVALQAFFGGEERVGSEIRLVGSTDRADWMWKAFLPAGASRDHEVASPEKAVAGLGEGFPPAMVVTAGFDPLQDWQRRYYEGLRRVGKKAMLVEYPASIHGFYMFPVLKDALALMEELKGFIQEQQKKRQRQLAGADDGEVAHAAPAAS
ncbi:hypothetical protein Taro_008681 [Colocasia esculenta]|uniref:Alpha/beta hydrolase fold-3 domain-containing protein n=1 Tax=Colocasia esculenta TaxID=4460 RepID=A0A843TY88_COLES|nr:hypothetical protein [Colocasia esculenta]